MFSMHVELVSYLVVLAMHMALLQTFQIFFLVEVIQMIFLFHLKPAEVRLHLQPLAAFSVQPVFTKMLPI